MEGVILVEAGETFSTSFFGLSLQENIHNKDNVKKIETNFLIWNLYYMVKNCFTY